MRDQQKAANLLLKSQKEDSCRPVFLLDGGALSFYDLVKPFAEYVIYIWKLRLSLWYDGTMFKKKPILFMALGLIVGIGGTLFFLNAGQKGEISNLNKNNNISKSDVNPNVKSSAVKANQTVVQKDAEEKAEMDQCVEAKIAEVKKKGTDYKKDSLLVSFKKEVSLAEAKNLISSYSLSYGGDTEEENSFNSNHWLTVTVPKEQQFTWVCVLEKNSSIRLAWPTPLLNLHE
jgi:hypothetical protein